MIGRRTRSRLFKVHPKSDQGNVYLGCPKMLRPELEQIEGFVDSIRDRSLTHEGWRLSFSNWRDEKTLFRWRPEPRIPNYSCSRNFHIPLIRIGNFRINVNPSQFGN